MSVIAGTLKDIQLVQSVIDGVGARKTYLVSFTVATMTAGDTAAITALHTAIGAVVKNGRTLTLRQCMGAGPGVTPGGTAAYALICTINGNSAEFSVGTTTVAAAEDNGTRANIFVSLDES
jgi:hypothetical protein